MRKLSIFILILTMSSVLFAQDDNCKNKVVNDSDKRDFTKSSTFSFDVDGDGKTDNFTHRTYKTKVAGKSNSKIKETHWITFDLQTSSGKTLKSFYKFNYGNNLADFWIYAIVPCKIGQGAKNDLLFYTGDDGGGETVILKNLGNSFKVHSKKVTDF